ncbi:hypothetical protein P8625_01665 [Tenacibaculum tangerinum]|uniref:Uncharacterized protein n=1 Tax=Tenacibaculum tangerinum TaxID=3038772 RepID=A0ABY8L6S8_9FLAO|nr:hypothetical protein [Tenacibaculum tangerinum]WGH75898.1 hypothetical protein P8625_01665 [Tenacibaculum tangerinum]
MKTLHITHNGQPNQFIVSKKQVSKNKVLKTSVLYDKIESSANTSLGFYPDASHFSCNNIEFDQLNNAYLNDKLVIKNNIKKLSTTEIIFNITVSKKEEKQQHLICTAIFGYTIQKAC